MPGQYLPIPDTVALQTSNAGLSANQEDISSLIEVGTSVNDVNEEPAMSDAGHINVNQIIDLPQEIDVSNQRQYPNTEVQQNPPNNEEQTMDVELDIAETEDDAMTVNTNLNPSMMDINVQVIGQNDTTEEQLQPSVMDIKSLASAEETKMLDKQYVLGLECNLKNLITILRYAFQRLEKIQQFDRLVLTIGDTGSGKSTLNNSLVFGCDSLQVQTIQETIEIKRADGTTKHKKKSRKVIGAIVEQGVFKIGHSKSQSMTFLPDFKVENTTGYVFGDLAGFFDTGGSLIDLVNSFVTKKIFQKAS